MTQRKIRYEETTAWNRLVAAIGTVLFVGVVASTIVEAPIALSLALEAATATTGGCLYLKMRRTSVMATIRKGYLLPTQHPDIERLRHEMRSPGDIVLATYHVKSRLRQAVVKEVTPHSRPKGFVVFSLAKILRQADSKAVMFFGYTP